MTSSNGNLLWGIHGWPVNSPHKGQWRGALVFSLICAWTNGWVNNRQAGDLRRHRAHYDIIVMLYNTLKTKKWQICRLWWKLQCCQWRRSWHQNNCRFSVYKSCVDLNCVLFCCGYIASSLQTSFSNQFSLTKIVVFWYTPKSPIDKNPALDQAPS